MYSNLKEWQRLLSNNIWKELGWCECLDLGLHSDIFRIFQPWIISTLSHDLQQNLEKKVHQNILLALRVQVLHCSSGLPLSGFQTCGLTKISKITGCWRVWFQPRDAQDKGCGCLVDFRLLLQHNDSIASDEGCHNGEVFILIACGQAEARNVVPFFFGTCDHNVTRCDPPSLRQLAMVRNQGPMAAETAASDICCNKSCPIKKTEFGKAKQWWPR